MIEEKEFADIISRTKKVVLSAINKYLAAQHVDIIDDIVQETYLRAYRSLVGNKFRFESSLETWLYTIARNETLRMLKKVNREERKREKVKEKMMHHIYNDDEESYQVDTTIDLINKLPGQQQEVFLLAINGYKEKEIAAKLQIPKGTVKSRLSRGRELLRRLRKEETYE